MQKIRHAVRRWRWKTIGLALIGAFAAAWTLGFLAGTIAGIVLTLRS